MFCFFFFWISKDVEFADLSWSVPKNTSPTPRFLILFLAFMAFWHVRRVLQLLCCKSGGCACCLLALSFSVVGHEMQSSCCESGKWVQIPRYDWRFLASKRNKTMHLASCFLIVLPLDINDFIKKKKWLRNSILVSLPIRVFRQLLFVLATLPDNVTVC